jgi:transketolase
MPGLVTLRPADATETVGAWHYALAHRDRPVALLLGKHEVPALPSTTGEAIERVARGAYVVADAPDGTPAVILLSAGTEVAVAMEARALLAERGVAARVVSMPSWELFRAQETAYRDTVLPPAIRARVSVEAGVTFGWGEFVGLDGTSVGVDRFGECGPAMEVLEYLGITAERVRDEALRVLGREA